MATYSFLDVQASIAGPGGSFSLGSGSGNGEEGISIVMVDEKDLATVGADGSLMHSLRASNVGRVSVKLLKTSPVNAKLSALYNFQRISSALWGLNVFSVADVVRGDVGLVSLAAFVKQPDVVWAKDGNTNDWEFIGNVDLLLGTGSPVAS